ncbi:hypothetical protein MMC32_003925 [Xylographa parallela]|nr:hypothetical protein [Xylographa parallela]
MSRLPRELHRVIEACACNNHRRRTYGLPHHQHCQPEPQKGVVPGCRPKGQSEVRKECVPEQTFQHRTRVRHVICPPIRRKQEGSDVRFQGVVLGGAPEFEEVEEREGGEEERNPPEVGRLIEKVDSVYKGRAESGAEEASAHGDAGEGPGARRKSGLEDGPG